MKVKCSITREFGFKSQISFFCPFAWECTNIDYTHFVLLKADFPRRKIHKLSGQQQLKNNKLAEKYNPQGFFPFVVVLDKTGKVLGTTGYRKVTPTKYVKLLSSF